MKITKDHYKIIKNAINKVIMDNPCAYDDYQKKGLCVIDGIVYGQLN